jgi:hypothetical protein
MTLTPSKILELLAAICFLAVAVGQAHVGVVSLEALGLFLLALGLAV